MVRAKKSQKNSGPGFLKERSWSNKTEKSWVQHNSVCFSSPKFLRGFQVLLCNRISPRGNSRASFSYQHVTPEPLFLWASQDLRFCGCPLEITQIVGLLYNIKDWGKVFWAFVLPYLLPTPSQMSLFLENDCCNWLVISGLCYFIYSYHHLMFPQKYLLMSWLGL